jgi:mannose-6-phosphate isomerase-like protein (cupin superfamily)
MVPPRSVMFALISFRVTVNPYPSPTTSAIGIEFVFNIIPLGKESGVSPPHKPGVKEFVVVARGKLRAILGEQTSYDLTEGDSMYFEAHVPHRFVNVGHGECEYYQVIDSHEA